MGMVTDPTVTVATGFLPLMETPNAISSFMVFWWKFYVKMQVFLG